MSQESQQLCIDRDKNREYFNRGLFFLREMYRKGSPISDHIEELDSSKPRSLRSASPRVFSEITPCMDMKISGVSD